MIENIGAYSTQDYNRGYKDGINKAIDIHKDSEETDFESLLLLELEKIMKN